MFTRFKNDFLGKTPQERGEALMREMNLWYAKYPNFLLNHFDDLGVVSFSPAASSAGSPATPTTPATPSLMVSGDIAVFDGLAQNLAGAFGPKDDDSVDVATGKLASASIE